MATTRLTAELEAAKANLRAACAEYDKGGLTPTREQIVTRSKAQSRLEQAERAVMDAEGNA